MDKILEVIQYH